MYGDSGQVSGACTVGFNDVPTPKALSPLGLQATSLRVSCHVYLVQRSATHPILVRSRLLDEWSCIVAHLGDHLHWSTGVLWASFDENDIPN
jgi:hypothetical protein